MLDVWLTNEKFVLTKLKGGNIDWVYFINESDWFGAGLNSSDGAESNNFVVWTGDFGAGTVREEFFAGRNNAAIGTPEIVEDWRDNTVMHVTANYEIKIGEEWLNVGMIEMDGGVNKCDFGFVGW